MKVMITGSSGFIASSLIPLLNKEGIDFIKFDIRNNPLEDIRSIDLLKKRAEGVDGIVHLAAISRVKMAQDTPYECVSVNIGGTCNVLEVARTSKNKPWVIFGSSREVFGEPTTLPVSETSPRHAINIYGVSKITGEDLCKIYSNHYGVKTRILRFSNVYTNCNDHLDRVIPRFILQALKNEDLVINGDGTEIFDFTYISDTISAILKVMLDMEQTNLTFNDYNISSGIPVSLKDLATKIIALSKSKSKISFAMSHSYDVNRFYADPSKATEQLGFKVNIGINEGLSMAIKELKDNIHSQNEKNKRG
jgi:UDP-glucose 4-epimerase